MGQITVCLNILISTLLIVILSIVTAFIGIVKWSDDILQFTIQLLFLPFLKQVNTIANETTLQRVIYHIRTATDHLTLAVFIVCITLLIILCFGMIGICYRSTVMIFIYILLLATSIALLSIWLIAESADPQIVNDSIKNQLKALIANYRSVESNEADSIILATLMPLFSCCGFTNGDDFENSRFTRNDFYQNKEYQDIQYPITCCQLYSNFSIKYPTCSISFNKLNSNFQTGCWDKLNEFILVIRHTMMLVIVGKIGILFILSGLSSLEIIPHKETFVYA